MEHENQYLGDKDDYLVWLWRANQERLEAEIEVDKCVRALRSMGCPWDEIARSLGVSKQAAWGKFGRGQ